jgi:hypothetical protein
MDKAWSEFEKSLADARAFIAPGSRWQHYKGGTYVVIDLVIIELTGAVGVVYRSMDHPLVTWLGPLVEWQDMMDYEGKQVFRFRLLGV